MEMPMRTTRTKRTTRTNVDAPVICKVIHRRDLCEHTAVSATDGIWFCMFCLLSLPRATRNNHPQLLLASVTAQQAQSLHY